MKRIIFEDNIYDVIDETETHYNVGASSNEGYHWIDKSKAVVLKHSYEDLRPAFCHSCGKLEYYGMLIWGPDHHTHCRKCTYSRWEAAGTWRRTDKDPAFPFYEDGVDYTKYGGPYDWN